MATDNEKVEAKAVPAKPESKVPEAKPQPMQTVEAKPATAPQPKVVKLGEPKVKFLVWFTGALNRFEGIQAHHLTTVRAYFQNLGIGEPDTVDAYDKGLLKFGFGRKK